MFAGLLKKLGAWTTLVKWNEPIFFRARLRGDWGARLMLATGAGFLGIAILLGLFSLNDRPPHPLHSLWGGVLFGGFLGMYLFRGKSTASGRVRICEEGIIRVRQYVGIGAQWIENAEWPYERIRASAIVPRAKLGSSYSVLLLATDTGVDMIGVPASTDLQQLATHLTHRNVQVHSADEVPPTLRKRMSPIPGAILLFFGATSLLIAIAVLVLTRAARPPARPPRDVAPIAPGVPAPVPRPEFDSPLLRPREPVLPGLPGLAPGGALPDLPPAPPGAIGDGTPFPRIGRFGPGGPGAPGVAPSLPTPPVRTPPGVSPPAAPPKTPGGRGNFSTTDLAGVATGELQSRLVGDRRAIVGFRYETATWRDRTAVASLEPLAKREDAGPGVTVAKDGYAVGGLQVVATEAVWALRVVYVKQTEAGLDKSDYYYGPWIGDPGDATPVLLGDGRTRLAGVQLHRDEVLRGIRVMLRTP